MIALLMVPALKICLSTSNGNSVYIWDIASCKNSHTDAKYQSFHTLKGADSQYVFLIFKSPWIECMHILQEEK